MIENVLVAETAQEEFMLRIAIIIGSTRPGRKGEAVAKWVYEIAQKRSDAEFESSTSKTSTCRSSTSQCRH
jgi:NADPH-dependent FMN reductase